MRKFLLYVHTGRLSALAALDSVARDLRANAVEPLLLDTQMREIRSAPPQIVPPGLVELLDSNALRIVTATEIPASAELCIVLGGDGTILRALEVTRDHSIAIHGVNLGHVGFLAESEVEDLGATVRRLLDSDYVIENRSALAVTAYDRDNREISREWALNEASLEKADRERMMYAVVGIDGRPVSQFGCDGVLLSTPTGSTAYAFSAGGPVMWPEVDAMLVIPLAAHALFARPMILGRSSKVEIEISEDTPAPAVLTMDGRRSIDLAPGSRVEAELSRASVQFARFQETPFANRLVDKFRLPVEGWRGRGPDARLIDQQPGEQASC